MPPPVILFLVLSVAVLFFKRTYEKHKINPQGLPYPPGPNPLPVIGNVLDIPKVTPWLTYARWGKQFGANLDVSMLMHLIIPS